MAKHCDDPFLDGGLDAIDNCTKLTICAGDPPNFAGIASRKLAEVVMTAGSGNGDYLKANGDTSGRKLTVLAQSAMSITASGTADHVVLDDGTNVYVTTCTSQVLTSGGTVSTPAYDIEIADPT